MRLWDYSRRDPRSGAYQAGQRIDPTTFAATTKQAETALRKLCAGPASCRVRTGSNGRPRCAPDFPPLIEVADDRLELAGRTGELAPSSIALYAVALGHVRRTSMASMAIADVRPADVAACLSEVQSLAGTSGRSYRAGTGMAKTTRAVLNRTFRHAVEQGWIDSNPVRDGGSIRTPNGAPLVRAARRPICLRTTSSTSTTDSNLSLRRCYRANAWTAGGARRHRAEGCRFYWFQRPAICLFRFLSVSRRRAGQTDIRGLATAGRAVRAGSVRCSKGRAWQREPLLLIV